MSAGVDAYLKALIRTKVVVDSASRVWLGDKQLEVIQSGRVRKVLLPGTKFLLSIEDLLSLGATMRGGRTPKSMHLAGANARWAENQAARAAAGLPPNVYVANQRTIDLARDRGETVSPRFIGRRRNQMTEVYDTVDEVVKAMDAGQWRTEFSRGRFAKNRPK